MLTYRTGDANRPTYKVATSPLPRYGFSATLSRFGGRFFPRLRSTGHNGFPQCLPVTKPGSAAGCRSLASSYGVGGRLLPPHVFRQQHHAKYLLLQRGQRLRAKLRRRESQQTAGGEQGLGHASERASYHLAVERRRLVESGGEAARFPQPIPRLTGQHAFVLALRAGSHRRRRPAAHHLGQRPRGLAGRAIPG